MLEKQTIRCSLLRETNMSLGPAMTHILSEAVSTRIGTVLGSVIQRQVDPIRLPYPAAVIYRNMKYKSYIWWMDDPWAALVALAAIIILLCIVGIIVIIFTHSRYMKFISQYRAYQSSYENPDFVEPPSFLREYETQSLNMYVPPDEAIQSYGEVGLHLHGDGLVDVQHTSHDPGVVAAVNPVYQTDQGAQTLVPPARAGYSAESTTML